MPTPAKLVSAVLFAALCWYTVELIRRYGLPEGRTLGAFPIWVTLGGLLVGWLFVGRRVSGPTNRGTKLTHGLTAGIGGALIIAVLGLLLNSFVTMITLSLTSIYTEIGQAIDAWIGFFMEDLRIISHPRILGTFFGGGALAGLVGGVVGRVTR